MKNIQIYILVFTAFLLSGCAAGIKRTGYHLPEGQASKDLPRRTIAIQCDPQFSINEVESLGTIHAYDTGFSVDCDEVAVLDAFCREGTMVGADIIHITKEKQPSILGSTCYRADAEFLRVKDREKARILVSDAKYAPDLIVNRAEKSNKRSRQVLVGAVGGGLLGYLIVAAATAPEHHSYQTNSVPQPIIKKL